MDLRSVVDDLYSRTPQDFVRARDDLARRLRGEGDRELAATTRSLRRPAAGAAAVNLLVRAGAGVLDDLLAVGSGLRAAQRDGDGDAIRELDRRRRALVDELGERAVDVAAEHDVHLGPAAVRSLTETLRSATVDGRLAQAVASGQLVATIEATGLAAVDVEQVVAVPDLLDETEPEPAARALRVVRDDARREKAEQALQDAEDRRAAAHATVERHRRSATQARGHLADLEVERRRLEARLRSVEQDVDGAERSVARAERETEQAEREIASAERAVERARRRLLDLDD